MKRLAIFMHWDKDSIIDDYVVTYIKGLLEVCEDIIFVSNSLNLTQIEKNKVVNYTSQIFTRENKGLDFAAWKFVIDEIGYNFLDENYDEIILVNDSCFAPIFPFCEMFDKMESENYDFWGCTEYQSDSKYTSHIQSYFLVFNKNLFLSEAFSFFFKGVKNNGTYDHVVDNTEALMTQYFVSKGFKCGIYLDHETVNLIDNIDHHNYLIMNWKTLIELKSPFIKRKVFNIDANPFNRKSIKNIQKLEYILSNNNSQYDSTLIKNYLQRCAKLSDLLYFKKYIIISNFIFLIKQIKFYIKILRMKLKIRTRIKAFLEKR